MKSDGYEPQDNRRFGFGKNWERFLRVLDEDRVAEAEKSLVHMLGRENLQGKSFIDVGSGSGLFSLAARRLGARVHSFDFDVESVACTMELKRRYYPNDLLWTVQKGSVLDVNYLLPLGTFDVCYSWGVLHHTGSMRQAFSNIVFLVAGDGQLFISIYNDQGVWSRIWRGIKKFYNSLPTLLKLPYTLLIMAPHEIAFAMYSTVTLRPKAYVQSWTQYKNKRGMSKWSDLVDWVGGYPFEVAKPEVVFDFFHSRGFQLKNMKTCGGRSGCNEFVFIKKTSLEV